MKWAMVAALVPLFGCSNGCSNNSFVPADGGADLVSSADLTPGAEQLLTERPYGLYVPSTFQEPGPLLVALHGYTSNGQQLFDYFGLKAVADAHGVLVAYPDGVADSNGLRSWDATEACCNFSGHPVDDVTYLTAVVADVSRKHQVDGKRVFFTGHSNGGFMSHRMACERAELVAAAVSLAGAQVQDASKCQPSRPVAVAQIHGDADETISYTGGETFPGLFYPSAMQTAATWAAKNGCDAALTDAATALDLVPSLAGDETRVARHEHCMPGGAAELWTVMGGNHGPVLSATFGESIWTFLSTHARQ